MNEDEVKRAGAFYRAVIDGCDMVELSAEVLVPILLKVAANLALDAKIGAEDYLKSCALTYDFEQFTRPSSDEIH
jgi:hypothetical protein